MFLFYLKPCHHGDWIVFYLCFPVFAFLSSLSTSLSPNRVIHQNDSNTKICRSSSSLYKILYMMFECGLHVLLYAVWAWVQLGTWYHTSFHLVFWESSLTDWSLLAQLDSLANVHWGPSSARTIGICHNPGLFTWLLEIKLSSSYLIDKHFIGWAISLFSSHTL